MLETKIKTLEGRLQEAMELRKVSATDISNATGFSPSVISKWLHGKNQNMRGDSLYKLAEFLNVSEGWLMGYDVPIERRVSLSMTPDQANLVKQIFALPEDKMNALLSYLNFLLADTK